MGFSRLLPVHEPRGRTRPQRGFEALERVADGILVGLGRVPCVGRCACAGHRGLRHGAHAGAQRPQLVQAWGERRVCLRVELSQRGRERCVELDRGVGEASLVEVQARTQGELLAQ